ncbi:uncharacterized protein LOC111691848 [Anoplophora glabripennis]|uniref:uncharacterized protein LOC111691848 n=1 Tax=Anoplophora glabripennis TaxID=217634 RepID=UPI000C76FAB2|nr:uncharacterized protein LOC111691848 [Anoplophora glabripennis]
MSMEKWETTLRVNNGPAEEIGSVKVKKGIFQGDSLSALWFCLSLNPMSRRLNKMQGIKIQEQNVTHLLYMDDLKLYAESKTKLDKLIGCVETISTDLRMNFGIDKCKINAMKNGKWEQIETYQTRQNEEISSMEEQELYKYFYIQARGIDRNTSKTQIMKKFEQRLNRILRTELWAKNKFKAINSFAIPVLTYSFGIIKWTNTELQDLDRRIRTALTKHRVHHPRSEIERLYIPRSKGGRGLTSITNLHYRQIKHLREYFYMKARDTTLIRNAIKLDTNITPLYLHNYVYDTEANITTIDNYMNNWKRKPLHGKHPQIMEQEHIDSNASYKWLQLGYIYSESEGFLIAIQDQVVNTKYYRKHIIGDQRIDDKCRLCGVQSETIDHIVSGCTVMAATEYTTRHNNVAKIIHQEVCKEEGIATDKVPYYKYSPQNVIETETTKIYWNWQIITDRPIQHNIPDIVLQRKDQRITYLIEISIPNVTNLEKKNREKITKYLPLAAEVREMWQQDQTIIVPIILGATGEIPKNLGPNLKSINLKENIINKLQKSVIIDTCSLCRKTLSTYQDI